MQRQGMLSKRVLQSALGRRPIVSYGHLSNTLGAEGYPGVNARYKPEPSKALPMPSMDTSLGTPSQKHWEAGRWTDDEIREAAKDHAMMTWTHTAPIEDLPIMERGEGVYLFDSRGNKYLDWTSQAVCTNMGYNVPDSMKAALLKQLGSLPYMYGGLGLVEIRARLAKLLGELAPGDINGFLFPCGGSEANEAAIRMARLYSGREKIMTHYRSYHGGSSSALSATGDFRRNFVGSTPSGFVKIFNPQPHNFSWGSTDESACQRALACLEDQILAEGPGTIAAIMLESIVGAGGVLVPPAGYMEGVRMLCDKHDILMICDEVMAGFGRTGKFFAFQHFDGVLPDIITSAKGLTASFLPLSMVGVRQKIKDHFWNNKLGWGATYHAHPIALACGYEAVKHMIDRDLVGHVQNLQPVMLEEISRLAEKHPCVKQGRAVGLFGCLDIVGADGHSLQQLGAPMCPEAALLKRAMTRHGLFGLFRPPLLHCSPPLTITEEELRDGFRRLSGALSVLDEHHARLNVVEDRGVQPQSGFADAHVRA